MSEDRDGGNGLMGRLGSGVAGGPLGSNGMQSSPAPSDDNSVDVPHLGRIDRGASPIHDEHNVTKAFYNKMKEGVRRLDHVRVELDKLVDMGDTVSPEEIRNTQAEYQARWISVRSSRPRRTRRKRRTALRRARPSRRARLCAHATADGRDGGAAR